MSKLSAAAIGAWAGVDYTVFRSLGELAEGWPLYMWPKLRDKHHTPNPRMIPTGFRYYLV